MDQKKSSDVMEYFKGIEGHFVSKRLIWHIKILRQTKVFFQSPSPKKTSTESHKLPTRILNHILGTLGFLFKYMYIVCVVIYIVIRQR